MLLIEDKIRWTKSYTYKENKNSSMKYLGGSQVSEKALFGPMTVVDLIIY